MNRLRFVLLGCCVLGCDQADERITALETRIAELEQKQAALATLPEEQKAATAKVAVLQSAVTQNADSLAVMRTYFEALQQKEAVLEPPGTASDVAAKPTPMPGKIGIAACDDYIAKYTQCIEDNVPEGARASMMEAMAQTAKLWKDAARGPAKASLAEACETARDAAAKETESMGCKW
ncbi:MAG TPA: hypothetical protein VFG69_13795 [Nannocystaceae bacterium]|nr:hypothetical protein [Nannocystaceae bacterium]